MPASEVVSGPVARTTKSAVAGVARSLRWGTHDYPVSREPTPMSRLVVLAEKVWMALKNLKLRLKKRVFSGQPNVKRQNEMAIRPPAFAFQIWLMPLAGANRRLDFVAKICFAHDE